MSGPHEPGVPYDVGGPYEEISAGREPDRPLRQPRAPLIPRPRWSLSQWASQHRTAVVALAVAAALVLAVGQWAWTRTHSPAPADALRVRLSPAEYLLAGNFDGKGQAQVLLLLRVDVAAGFTDPVRLIRLEGGGLQTQQQHPVDASPAQFAVPAVVSCDQWTDGKGVRAVFRVGRGAGEQVSIPLDSGPNSPVHAQITVPCSAFAETHPLRLTVFSVALEPKDPAAQTTWTVVNRSASPVTLDPADDVELFGNGHNVPMAPVPTDDQPVVVAPHNTVSVVRTLVVQSCLRPVDLDPTGQTIRLTGSTSALSGPPSGQADVDLPFAFVTAVFSVARDACKGSPDLTGATASMRLDPRPPGHGRAELTVRGPLAAPGPWTARIDSTSDLRVGSDVVSGQAVQHVQGPGDLALSVRWTVRTCTSTDLTLPGVPLDTVVTVSGIRTYPYVLPVTVTGRTSCTPGGVQG